MLTIAASTLYICLHFGVYAGLAHRVPSLRTERGIFLFHFISAVSLTLAASAFSMPNGYAEALTVAAAVAAVHGIYSMSFLELWSLSQGSYSYTILAAFARGERLPASVVVQDSERVGEQKKEQRLDGLVRLGLVKRIGDLLALRPPGQIVARLLRAIRWIANLRDTG
jgi:hypothetical protein